MMLRSLTNFASANFLVDLVSSLMFLCRGQEAFRSIEEAGIMNPLLNDLGRSSSGKFLYSCDWCCKQNKLQWMMQFFQLQRTN